LRGSHQQALIFVKLKSKYDLHNLIGIGNCAANDAVAVAPVESCSICIVQAFSPPCLNKDIFDVIALLILTCKLEFPGRHNFQVSTKAESFRREELLHFRRKLVRHL
jgi:hypothetical protein